MLIGGAACNLLEEELNMNPRATKDLDLVLVVEALTPDFGARLWDFIKSSNYTGRNKGENEFKHEYYRFILAFPFYCLQDLDEHQSLYRSHILSKYPLSYVSFHNTHLRVY